MSTFHYRFAATFHEMRRGHPNTPLRQVFEMTHRAVRIKARETLPPARTRQARRRAVLLQWDPDLAMTLYPPRIHQSAREAEPLPLPTRWSLDQREPA